jgi:phosphoribosyl 1,2-cyclic phosphodiesterase
MKLKTISTGSKGNAYILETNAEALLIECGVTFPKIKQAIDFNVSKIKGCIITHEHLDHAKHAKDLIKQGIDTYATQGTFKALKINTQNHRVHEFCKDNNENWNNQKIGGFTIKPFDINHDAAQPVGFLIHHPECGTTLYLTDTSYSNYIFKGLNNLIIECNYSDEIIENKLNGNEFLRDRIIGSHMSLETLLELLSKNDLSKVNNIVLIHLSDSNSNAIEFKNAVRKATNCNVIVSEANQIIAFDKTPF